MSLIVTVARDRPISGLSIDNENREVREIEQGKTKSAFLSGTVHHHLRLGLPLLKKRQRDVSIGTHQMGTLSQADAGCNLSIF